MPTNIVKGFNVNGSTVQYDYESLSDRILKSSIGEIYSSSSTYKVDEYVLYAGQLYRCIVEVTTPQNFDSSKWEAVSVGDDLRYIKKYFCIDDGIKHAFLNLLSHVAYTDEHGQDYYDALEAELFRTADLISISAVFNQGQNIIYDTDSLDTLKQYLVVTATYDDSSTETVTTYTLSGTLTVGTSTITVSYAGKTTTFDVTVTEHVVVENFDKVGTPLIVDGIYTPSADSWIVTKDDFDPDTDLWEFVFKINRTGTSGFQNLISGGAIFYQANGTSVAIRLKSEGSSSYDIADGSKAFLIKANTPTWVKTGYYHNEYGYFYAVYTSTDGINYTLAQTFNPVANPINPGKIIFGSKASNTNAVTAEYDLNECYIKVNGVTVWTPYS